MQDHASDTPDSSPRKTPSRLRKRLGVAAFGAATVVLCSGATQCGPTGGEVIGAGVGIGAGVIVVIALAVSTTQHGMTGCVIPGPNGPELQTSDMRYALDGDIASIKVGDRVKINGKHIKKTKDQKGDQVYRVEKIKKDYGPCPVKPPAA